MLPESKYPEISIESLAGYTEDAPGRRSFLWSCYGIVGIAAAGFAVIVVSTVFGGLALNWTRGFAMVACLATMVGGIFRAYRFIPRSRQTGRPMHLYRNASAPAGILEVLYVDPDSRTYFRHVYAVPPTD
ncbi:hypothetical protein [Prosthecobacter fluviatilis]|uniref:Uncharacterized protein n=1 Tax=Prosthecobacter fluviatilis TaxID=445931 RepID=A0ABW0KW80_9BACT